MSKREVSESRLTLPQVKKVLETIGEENLDQFQRRTLDYVSKFSKVDPTKAEELFKLSQRIRTEKQKPSK
jgi:DNA-directed RNA polymerase subunit F